MQLNNKYYIMRHGQAVSNVKNIISSWPEKFHNPLTKLGREQVKESAKNLLDKNINYIFASPLLRTKQTAEIAGKILKIKPQLDMRLKEQDAGESNGTSIQLEKRQDGENYEQIKERMLGFLNEIDSQFKDKNILIVSHELPLKLLEETFREVDQKFEIKTAQLLELN